MLAPQFSFRTLLAGMAVAGFASLVLAAAFRGDLGAISVAVGVGGIVLCFMLFFLVFALAFAIASAWSLVRGKPRATPFGGSAPRQVLPTQDAD
jgi:hypothetical protein